MAENSPAYLFYPKDILSSGRVSALTPLEELWYRRALDQSWLHEGLPANPAEFAGWIGRGCTVKAAETIIAKFFIPYKKNSDKVINPRQEKERANLRKKIKQKSDAGKRGMANRWKQKSKSDNSVITEHNIPIPIPIQYKEEEIREGAASLPDPKSHPAIVAIHHASGTYPPKEIYQEIIDRLGLVIDQPRLDQCFRKWRVKGFKKQNYGWALDWYIDGIPTDWAGYKNGKHQTNTNGNKRTSAERIADHARIISQYPTEAELRNKSGKN